MTHDAHDAIFCQWAGCPRFSLLGEPIVRRVVLDMRGVNQRNQHISVTPTSIWKYRDNVLLVFRPSQKLKSVDGIAALLSFVDLRRHWRELMPPLAENAIDKSAAPTANP